MKDMGFYCDTEILFLLEFESGKEREYAILVWDYNLGLQFQSIEDGGYISDKPSKIKVLS